MIVAEKFAFVLQVKFLPLHTMARLDVIAFPAVNCLKSSGWLFYPPLGRILCCNEVTDSPTVPDESQQVSELQAIGSYISFSLFFSLLLNGPIWCP